MEIEAARKEQIRNLISKGYYMSRQFLFKSKTEYVELEHLNFDYPSQELTKSEEEWLLKTFDHVEEEFNGKYILETKYLFKS